MEEFMEELSAFVPFVSFVCFVHMRLTCGFSFVCFVSFVVICLKTELQVQLGVCAVLLDSAKLTKRNDAARAPGGTAGGPSRLDVQKHAWVILLSKAAQDASARTHS